MMRSRTLSRGVERPRFLLGFGWRRRRKQKRDSDRFQELLPTRPSSPFFVPLFFFGLVDAVRRRGGGRLQRSDLKPVFAFHLFVSDDHRDGDFWIGLRHVSVFNRTVFPS